MEIIPENFNSGEELINSWGYKKYGGPKPSKGKIHRYYFRIYAINTKTMDCKNLDEFRKEVEEKKISEGFLLGKYEAK